MFLIHPSKLSTKSSSRIKCKFKTGYPTSRKIYTTGSPTISIKLISTIGRFFEAFSRRSSSSARVRRTLERRGRAETSGRVLASVTLASRYARDTHRSNWVTSARATAFSCPWENDAAPVFLSRESSIFRLFCPPASSPKYAKDERPTEPLFSSLDHRCRIRFLAFAAREVLSSS